jgi:hypothetical protein
VEFPPAEQVELEVSALAVRGLKLAVVVEVAETKLEIEQK